MKIQNALITGGAGFLGSHLAETLLAQGVNVIAIDNFCTGSRANLDFLNGLKHQGKFHFIEADAVTDWQSAVLPTVKKFGLNISHFFHFASPASPPLYQELALETMAVNTKGLENVMDLADQMSGRVVFASTSEIYGDPLVHPQPEDYRGNVNTLGPRSCYDEAKRFGETIIFTRNWKKKSNHGLVRIFNTYGPRMNPNDGRVVINFLMQAARGEKLSIYGTGQQTRSFCYVSDLIEGILQYARSDLAEAVNLGNDREFSILELAQAVEKIFGKRLGFAFRDLPVDDPVKRKPDLKKARKLLAPWSPSVSLEEGLKKMKHWCETEGLL